MAARLNSNILLSITPRSTAKVCAQWMMSLLATDHSNNNKKFRSLKSKENIHKKEVGPYHGFGY